MWCLDAPWLGLVALLAHTSFAACPTGWFGDDSACFQIPQDYGTFIHCQDVVCTQLGGTLASIRSPSEQDSVEDLMRQYRVQRVYIGAFEAGEDESGDWQWVDGSLFNYTHWNPGEPNEYCTDEDCGVFLPTWYPLGWSDASCTIEGWLRCLCRHGGSPSSTYEDSKDNLASNSQDYSDCDTDDDGWGADNVCAADGFGSAAFTPNEIAKPNTPCSEIGVDEVQWSMCCCGFPDYCCASGDASCMDGVYDDDNLPDVPAAGNCPSPFAGPTDDACFYVSPELNTFVGCEEEVCEPLGGTLASIRTVEEEAYLKRVVGAGIAYIGGFEAGYDESGNWRWVDGGLIAYGYSHWYPGEPDDYCSIEDCMLFVPYYYDGWIDVSCQIESSANCICRYGGQPSSFYARSRENLLSAPSDYSACDDDTYDDDIYDDDEDAKEDYCEKFQYESAAFTPYVRAYPPENPNYPDVSDDGYSEGLCGYAAWEYDEEWAQCCCSDQSFCCPDGKDVSWCKRSATYNPACARGWDGPGVGSGCFKLTEQQSTFVGCQELCIQEGGNLASIRSAEENSFVRNMLQDTGALAFIGLFEYGEDESGDWRWVDGAGLTYEGWALGEPDNWCLDEDCASMASTWNNWFDISCSVESRCVCRYGGAPSVEYTQSIDALKVASADYDSCGDEPNEKEGQNEKKILKTLNSMVRLCVCFCVSLALRASILPVGKRACRLDHLALLARSHGSSCRFLTRQTTSRRTPRNAR